MSETVERLFVCTKNRMLQILLQGIAMSLDLKYQYVPRFEDVNGQLSVSHPGVMVVGVSRADDDLYTRVRTQFHDLHIPVIIVIDRLTRGSKTAAFRSGATACLRTDEAMQSLAYLVENIVHCLLQKAETQALPVSNQVMLILPDFILTDGQHEVRLPPIPGRLLRYLALSPDCPVSSRSLIRSVWGKQDSATITTLHQQVYNLREALSEYGIRHLVRSVYSQGYMLDRANEQSSSSRST